VKIQVVTLCFLSLCRLVAAESVTTATVGFDEAAIPYGEHVLIKDGYGGLLWQNFGIVNGTLRPAAEGYHTGVVSPDNVAFNLSGDPATVGSPRPFKAESAQLTSASPNGMVLHIQGFNRDAKVYDSFQILGTNGPTRVEFGSILVDRLTFTPPSTHWFALDDLTISQSITTLGFDDIEVGQDHVTITNGYGGLNWKNFGIFNGSKRPEREGYKTGTVSPENIAFNQSGDPAAISGSTPFILRSGQFTAAFVDGMSLRIRGYRDGQAVYDQTRVLRTNGPTLIEFDPTEVDRVAFVPTPSTPFVLDDLSYPTAERDAHSGVDLGQVVAGKIFHQFTRPFFPGPPSAFPAAVSDYLVGGLYLPGAATLPDVTANFDANNRFKLTVSAPAGQKFVVRPPLGQAVHFLASLTWQGPNVLSNGPSYFGKVDASFSGFEGDAPGFSDSRSVLSKLHGFFGFNDVVSTRFTNELAFTSMTLVATVPSAYVGVGTLLYKPTSDRLLLHYSTTSTNDPGSFVTLEPIVPPVVSQPVRFRIRTSEITISWNTTVGRQYQVQGKQTLTDPEWTNLGPVRIGTGGILEQAEPTGDPARMYRVVELR
jgi:hypothetical protein